MESIKEQIAILAGEILVHQEGLETAKENKENCSISETFFFKSALRTIESESAIVDRKQVMLEKMMVEHGITLKDFSIDELNDWKAKLTEKVRAKRNFYQAKACPR